MATVLTVVLLAWSGLVSTAADAGSETTSGEFAVGADAGEVIRRVVERAQAVGKDTNAPLAVFDKHSFYETLDSEGRVKQVKEKRYEVSVRRGMTHNRLVAVNGRRLSEEESAAQSEKERRWRESYASTRSSGSPDRVDQVVNERLFARFRTTVAGRERVRGHDCLVVALEPRSDGERSEERLMDRVINLMHGRMWVDLGEYEIVSAQVETQGTLRVWGGVLGALEFMSLHVDREPGAGGVWFNRHLEVNLRGRKLFSSMAIRAREIGSGLRLVESAPQETAASGTPAGR